MPEPNAALQQPSDNSEGEMSREERLKIAARIVEFSEGRLSQSEDRKQEYVVLKIGSGPYSNAVRVRDNRVSFFIRSEDLRVRVIAAGFKLTPVGNTTPINKHKIRIWELNRAKIEDHEVLFREIVNESVSLLMDMRPKKN
jgi:hypothetical protein